MQNIPGSVADRYGGWIKRFFAFIEEPVRVEEIRMSPPLLGTVGGVRAYYAISMIGVEILFIGLSMGVFAIIDRKRDRTLSVILSSPIRSWELFLADTLTALAAIGISSLAILLFSLLLGAEYHITPTTAAAVAGLLALSAVFTIGLGLLLAVAARSQESAMVIVNGVAFPVMFIGGIIIPPFVLPESLQRFASAYPLSRLVEAVRQLLVYEKTPGWALSYSLPAVAATIVVYALGFKIYNYLLAKTVEE
ncbi:MAG: ABC transporter permease, partial [Desulfurococcales archaeon]|nr:ABC transporter permease [Desulfurococcales archaeon]